MLAHIAQIAATASATVLFVLSTASTAQAAYKAECNHPSGGYCTVVRASGDVTCGCGGETYEGHDDTVSSADDQQLLDACWDAYSLYCTDRTDEVTSCEEPDLGACEVSGADGGTADCDCAANGVVSEHDVDALTDLSGEDLEDECYAQLDRMCEPPPPSVMAAPAEPISEPGGATTGCSVSASSPAPLSLLMLLPVLAWRRRRS